MALRRTAMGRPPIEMLLEVAKDVGSRCRQDANMLWTKAEQHDDERVVASIEYGAANLAVAADKFAEIAAQIEAALAEERTTPECRECHGINASDGSEGLCPRCGGSGNEPVPTLHELISGLRALEHRDLENGVHEQIANAIEAAMAQEPPRSAEDENLRECIYRAMIEWNDGPPTMKATSDWANKWAPLIFEARAK